MSYEDFENSCVAKGYAYCNFNLAYQTWAKKDFNSYQTNKKHYYPKFQKKKLPSELLAELREQQQNFNFIDNVIDVETENEKYDDELGFLKLIKLIQTALN